ncbi:MAG: hypothetical protein HQK89_01405 [Nitrospirae bacterium]|nr:hypothetical protein [Nitrospirota bacterium]
MRIETAVLPPARTMEDGSRWETGHRENDSRENKRMSTMRRILVIYLAVGFVAAVCFPFYANFFVVWKPGMAIYFVLGCFVAGAFVGVSNYFIFKKLLRNFIESFSEKTMARIGEPLKVDYSADLYESVQHNFEMLLSTVRNNVDSIDQAAVSLMDRVCHISESSENIASNCERLCGSTGELKGHATRLAFDSEKIRQETANLSQRAENSGSLAKRALDSSNVAGRELSRIFSALNNTRHMLADVGDRIRSVEKFTASINHIASETNLLALNATIESAKAGEAGRGFAVVADKVRRLAMESSQASKGISSTIGLIVESVAKSEKKFLEELGGIEESSDAIKKALAQIGEIGALSIEIHEGIIQIDKLVAMQDASTTNIDSIIGNINDLSITSSKGATNVAESVTGIFCAVEKLTSNSKGLCSEPATQ